MEKYLLPKITREAVDFILTFLEMGTWTVIGNITRVYRGPNCEYKGWQRNTITTPEALLDTAGHTPKYSPGQPSWARLFLVDDKEQDRMADCSPEESRQFILDHLSALYPGNRDKFVSIHAPTQGATFGNSCSSNTFGFQSTLPRKERRYSSCGTYLPSSRFNPRSRAGSDSYIHTKLNSSTLLDVMCES